MQGAFNSCRELDSITEFHGDVATYRDWRRLVQLAHSSIRAEHRCLTGPRILSLLRGEAWAATEHIDPEELRNRGEASFDWLLGILDGLYGWQSESMLHEAMEGFLYFRTRRNQESITSFLAAFRTVLARFCAIVTKHRWQEAVVLHKQAVRQHKGDKLDWLEQTVIYQRAAAVADEQGWIAEADPGDPPAPPDEPIEIDYTFKLPEVISGFLLLRKLGIDRKGRSELLRASKGMEISKLEEVLRTSEAEHFARTGAARFAAGGDDAEVSREEIEDSDEFRQAYECFFASYIQGGSSSYWSHGSSAFPAQGSSGYSEDVVSDDGMDDYEVPDDPQEYTADPDYGDTLETQADYMDAAWDDYAFGLLAAETPAGDQELEDGLDAMHQAYHSFKSSRNYVNTLRKVRGLVPVRRTAKGKGKRRRRKGKGKGRYNSSSSSSYGKGGKSSNPLHGPIPTSPLPPRSGSSPFGFRGKGASTPSYKGRGKKGGARLAVTGIMPSREENSNVNMGSLDTNSPFDLEV